MQSVNDESKPFYANAKRNCLASAKLVTFTLFRSLIHLSLAVYILYVYISSFEARWCSLGI